MTDWKTVTDEVNDSTWDRIGILQGVYTQKKTGVGANDSNMYVLKNTDGNTSVWGSAVLDSRFEQIPIGAEVKLTSLGKVKSEKTGREYYDYKVEFRPVPFTEAGEAAKPTASSSSKPAPPSDDAVPVELYADQPVTQGEPPF